MDATQSDLFYNNIAGGFFGGILGELMQRIGAEFGVCCFSRRYDNMLLWSHYAAGHTGAAVCLDANHNFFLDNQPVAVKYSDVRPVVSASELRKNKFDVIGPWLECSSFVQDRLDILTTKATCWSYEREVRVIRQIGLAAQGRSFSQWHYEGRPTITGIDGSPPDHQLVEVPASAIVAIVLGAKHQRTFSSEFGTSDHGFEDEIRARLQLDSELSHVRVLRAHADFKKFRIEIFDPLDSSDATKYLHPMERDFYSRGMKGPMSASDLEFAKSRLKRYS